MVPDRAGRGRRRCARAVDGGVGDQRASPSAPSPPRSCTSPARSSPNILYGIGNEEQRHWAALAVERNWGATMVLTEPDAGSDVGAGRTKAIQQPDGTWHIDGVKRFITNGDTDDLFENILHLVLARPGGRRTGHQGTEPVPGAEVPFRSRDRRNRRPQRGFRHRSRTQDGSEGLGHMRTHLRSARRARRRLAGRRHPQRHRADVQDHRVRANDGGHQGNRHTVDRLSECVGLRQDPRAGRRHDADDRQGRAPRHHHSSSRCAAGAAHPEGIRRGAAGALSVHRRPSGRRRRRASCPVPTPSWPSGSTICCCRS